MPDLGKDVLLRRVETAISRSDWRMFIQGEDHPFRILVGRDGDSRNLVIYIWTITSGGPATVRPRDEFRIQITGVDSPLLVQPASQTLLLGWYEESGVFVAFDIQRHLTPGSSASIQVRLPALEEAVRLGFAFHRRTNNEMVVVFTPDQFMNYVLNQVHFHRFGTHPEQVQLLAAAREAEPEPEQLAAIPAERREVVHTVRQLVRERNFRDRVLQAYQHRCTVCHMQLQLVQAAHIVPVHVPGSSDQTANGLAVCPTHHVAYDNAILTVAPNYHVLVNQSKLGELRRANLNGREDLLLQYVCNTILLPDTPSDRPLPEYLEQGMRVRGWTLG